MEEAYKITDATLLTLIEAIQNAFSIGYQHAQPYKQGYISDCQVDIEQVPQTETVGARARLVIHGQFRPSSKSKERTPIHLLACEVLVARDGLRLYLTPPDLTPDSLGFRRAVLGSIRTHLRMVGSRGSFGAATFIEDWVAGITSPEKPTPDPAPRLPGGRPALEANRWAEQEVNERGRAPADVFPEWLQRLGPEADKLADPRDSFNKVLRRVRKKRIIP